MSDTELFLDYLKPIIADLSDIRTKMDSCKEEFDELSRFFSCVENDVKLIGQYDNQDFINQYLVEFGSERVEYQANTYLANNDNVNIHILPQYKEAINYLKRFISFLNRKKNEIEIELNNYTIIYNEKFIANKYYDIFSESNIYVTDPVEFINFMNSINLDYKVKLNIIKEVIESNVSNYKSEKYRPSESTHVIVHELLHENQELLEEDSVEFMIHVGQDINLGRILKDTINETVLEKHSINEIIKAKKIWLLKNINEKYHKCEYRKVTIYSSEYEYLNLLENRINGRTDEEVIRIIKEDK